MPEKPGDAELVQGCLDGKKESWDTFVERFSGLIHWAVRKTFARTPFSGRTDLCEDVFQEVFQRILEPGTLGRLRKVSSIRKYLSVIACNLALDRSRSLLRHEDSARRNEPAFAGGETFFAPLDGTPGDPAQQALSKEKDALIAGALGALSAKERTCMEFYYLDGKTHREISGILGMPQDTVSSIIRRTKDKLKKDLSIRGWV